MLSFNSRRTSKPPVQHSRISRVRQNEFASTNLPARPSDQIMEKPVKPLYIQSGAFCLSFLQLAKYVRLRAGLLQSLVVFCSFSPGLPAQEKPITIPGVVSLHGGRVNPQSYWGTVVSATHDDHQLVTRTSRGVQVWNLDDSTLESEFPVAGFTVNERVALAKDRSRVITFVSDSKTRQSSLVCMSLPDRETMVEPRPPARTAAFRARRIHIRTLERTGSSP